MIVLPYWSSAVTVVLKAVPPIASMGAETPNWLRLEAETATVAVPEPPEPVSVAVIVWLPADFSVALKLIVPALEFVNV